MTEEVNENYLITSFNHASDVKQVSEVLVHTIPHYVQSFSWDCGITCVQMVLSEEQSILLKQNLSLYCTEEIKNQSTWTIDLCYILNHFSVKFTYFTKTIGINPEFAKEKFYDGYITKDEKRVSQRFANAAKNGVSVQSKTTSLEEVFSHLENNGLAIVLADANLLDCLHCKSVVNDLGNRIKQFFMPKSSYLGHYIVVCGYDRPKKLLYYKDPAVKNEICYITSSAFEKARKAHGTDEDIIFIYR